jgi:polyisoprenyl-phosphate glycosyltransferase
MKQINIIVPCYNEEKNLEHFYNEISEELSNIKNYNFTLLFVNDGSSDNTLYYIKKIQVKNNSRKEEDLRVSFLDFSRNFGKEAATSAGIENSTNSDALIMIDADLQHPIEKIKEFISIWEDGAEVVVGVRSKNEKAGLIKTIGSKIFYKVMNAVGETEITPNATDFRLIDKKVILEFCKLTEHNRITRGLIDWMGYKREYLEFTANERFAGIASYSFSKLVKLALTSFVSHSLLPLKLAGYLGFFTTLFSGLLGLFIIIEKYFLLDPFNLRISAITQLAVLIVFLIGIILCCLGLIALYIGLISADTQKRPLFIVREKN